MWPQALILWEVDPFHLILEERTELAGHFVVGNQQLIFIRQRDEMTVKEPVDGSRKGYPILHNVGSTLTHAPYVRGLNF